MLPSRGVVQSLASARTAASRTTHLHAPRTYSTLLRPHNAVRPTFNPNRTAMLATAGLSVAGSRNLSWRFWQWGRKPADAPAPPTEAVVEAPTAAVDAAATATAPIPEAVAAVTPQVETVAAATTEAAAKVPEALTGLELESILAMSDQVGFLSKLGLDFGLGPSQSMMWLLEHVHVYSGLPWWGSIFVAQLIVRLVLFKPLLISHETTTRMQILRKTNPAYEQAMKDFRTSVSNASQDPQAKEEAMLARQTYLAMEKQHGINKLNMFWGMLQIPIGIGFYRVLNAMSDIPVPSLENGGFLWFSDLTVADPLYMLPLIGPAMMIGAMAANSKFMPVAQRQTTKLMMVVMMPLSVIFTAFLPAAVQWYFCSAAFFGALQNYTMARPGGRRLLGLSALPDEVMNPTTTPLGGASYQAPRSTAAVEKPQSLFQEAKGGFQNLIDTAKKAAGEKNDAKALLAEKRRREEAIQKESWEALRERMARKEQEARMRPRRFLNNKDK